MDASEEWGLKFRASRFAAVLAWALGCLAFASSAAQAATLHVIDSGDSGAGTLRTVIGSAGAGDTVVVDSGFNPSLTSGEIAIDKDLTIEGQGAANTTVTANNSSRIFNIGSITPGITVLVKDIKLQGGEAPEGSLNIAGMGGAGGDGGAISNAGTLTISNSTLQLNAAGTGGIGSPGGDGGDGGAISNSGALTISNSTLQGNTAGKGGDGFMAGGVGGNGGAISNSGALTISNSTFQGNAAGAGGKGGNCNCNAFTGGNGGNGGAIANSSGTPTILSSTLSGNAAGTGGLGGDNQGGATTGGGNGGNGGNGGALWASAAIGVGNSILSSNAFGSGGAGGSGIPAGTAGSNGSNANCDGSVTDNLYNIAFISVGDRGGCPVTFLNGDPNLAALANNGGPTQTMALGAGSVAIDNALANCPATDQRGFTRPQAPGLCDSGAFELDGVAPSPPTPPPPPSPSPLPSPSPPAVSAGTGPTGLQATALKRCFKKKFRGHRKRCRKKAKKLPV